MIKTYSHPIWRKKTAQKLLSQLTHWDFSSVASLWQNTTLVLLLQEFEVSGLETFWRHKPPCETFSRASSQKRDWHCTWYRFDRTCIFDVAPWIIISRSLWCPRTLLKYFFWSTYYKRNVPEEFSPYFQALSLSSSPLVLGFQSGWTSILPCFIIRPEPAINCTTKMFSTLSILIIHNHSQQSIWSRHDP